MAIVATSGAANANSYVTLVEAEAFLDNRIGSDEWFTSSLQEQALIQACFILDQFDYIGDRATTTQALEWPRVINDEYELGHDTFPYGATVIPPKLKNAQCEIAFWLVQTGGIVAAGTIDSMTIGDDVQIKYASGSSASVTASVDITGIPLQAARFLKGLRLINVLA